MPRGEGFKCNHGSSPNPPSDGDRAAISLLPFVPPPLYLSLSPSSPPSSPTPPVPTRERIPSFPRDRAAQEQVGRDGGLPREVIRHTRGILIPIPSGRNV